jgi:hypothetical protein
MSGPSTLRVTADSRLLQAAPGTPTSVTLDVTNTSEVIDGVSARVLGLDPALVSCRPPMLSLFPDANGRLAITLDIPSTFPAGRHPLGIELTSHTATGQREVVDVELEVSAEPRLELRPRPPMQRSGRRARFVVEVDNRGNVPLNVALTAVDAERTMRQRFSRTSVNVPAGQMAPITLDTRVPHHLFGNDLDRPFTVHAQGVVADGFTAAGDEPQKVLDDAALIQRQRPVIARGVLTVVVLIAIVGLWAGAFLFGLTKVFSSDPVPKAAPASFFVSSSAVRGLAASTIPGDVLAKGGALPAGVGGVISGRVVAANNGDGVGRIVVEALRQSATGLKLVTSSATQADGSYVVVGLFPGNYYLRFTAPGFKTVYYPSVPTLAASTQISAAPQQVTKAKATRIVGLPATIIGRVDTGQTATPVRTVVIARPLSGTSDKPVAHILTDAHGNYTLTGLPAPASYQLSFTAAGYLASILTEDVGGKQTRYEPVVRMSAGNGTISGIVTDGHDPLGGVTVTTTVNGQTYTTGTPTIGQKGRFTLGGLPTPGLYILTFRRDASTSTTQAVPLSPGGSQDLGRVSLIGGTDAVVGTVKDDKTSLPLGGATITVGGGPTALTTTSLTTGIQKGTFALTGLPVPGHYTLTVTLPGYTPVTRPLDRDGKTAPSELAIRLSSSLGSIAGRVLQPADPDPEVGSVGARVTVTDGSHVRSTTTVDAGSGLSRGGFRIAGLAPGYYSVTASRDGYDQYTVLVKVVAGQAVDNLILHLRAVN